MTFDILHWHPLSHHNKSPALPQEITKNLTLFTMQAWTHFSCDRGSLGCTVLLHYVQTSQVSRFICSQVSPNWKLHSGYFLPCSDALQCSVTVSERLLSFPKMSVVPFIVWRTPRSGSGTLRHPCRWTWRGIAGTVTLTCLGIRSTRGSMLLRLWAVAASQQVSSIEALRIPVVASRRSCVLCAHDTWEPPLCSLCWLPAFYAAAVLTDKSAPSGLGSGPVLALCLYAPT